MDGTWKILKSKETCTWDGGQTLVFIIFSLLKTYLFGQNSCQTKVFWFLEKGKSYIVPGNRLFSFLQESSDICKVDVLAHFNLLESLFIRVCWVYKEGAWKVDKTTQKKG